MKKESTVAKTLDEVKAETFLTLQKFGIIMQDWCMLDNGMMDQVRVLGFCIDAIL